MVLVSITASKERTTLTNVENTDSITGCQTVVLIIGKNQMNVQAADSGGKDDAGKMR